MIHPCSATIDDGRIFGCERIDVAAHSMMAFSL